MLSFAKSRRNVPATSSHPQFERKRAWWVANRRKTWQIETPFFRFVKRAARPSLNRVWRHFLLDDPDTKMSGVFCPAPDRGQTIEPHGMNRRNHHWLFHSILSHRTIFTSQFYRCYIAGRIPYSFSRRYYHYYPLQRKLSTKQRCTTS